MDALAPAPPSQLATPRRLWRLRSDAALAERYAQGDEAAFSVLFERHRASVFAVCMGVLGCRHDAEDAAQESFAALAVTLRSAPPRELRAWLARVARNAAIDAARRRRARPSGSELADDGALRTEDIYSSNDAKDDFASLLGAIRELPETQRTALLMRELAGHSYREIAELLEVDEDAVRGLIARARIGLRARREAAELPCSAARTAIAEEPDGRRHDKTVRRHIRGCASCRAYRSALRADARALRGIVTAIPTGGMAGGGAVVGLAAKGALLGGAATQLTTACAVSVCAVGGIVLLSPGLGAHRRAGAAAVHAPASTSGSHAPRRSATGALGSTRSAGVRSGSLRVGSSGVRGAAAHTRARSSETVVLQSRLSIAHTGTSTTGGAGTGAGSQRSSGGVPSSSPSQTGASSGPGGPTSGSSTHGGPAAGAPWAGGTPGSGPGSWTPGSGSSSGLSGSWPGGPTGTGSTQVPRTFGTEAGGERPGGGSSGSSTGSVEARPMTYTGVG
ncbi:MAG TPA: sigma-70 family RNA polymerase sigma factor [Solirubrobacteraceae bacterium]|nr:sigma-70 family RNA polymerase sigma factor [Solirubrobacteraceae bacterium]